MSMPRRWLDHDGPPEFLRLLKAARNEPVPRRAVERAVLTVSTTSLLGTVAGGALGATAKAATSSLGWAFAKWGAAAVFGLGLATTTAATVHHFKVKSTLPVFSVAPRATVPAGNRAARSAQPRPIERSTADENDARAPSPPPVASARDIGLSSSPSVAIEPDASSEPPVPRSIGDRNSAVEPRLPVGPRRVVVAPIETQIRPVSDAQLLQELHWIDRARTALRNGDPSVAIGLLDDYQRHCPAQRLRPEAQLLRVHAAIRLGNRAAAENAAQDIEAHYPNSPHVQKAKELVGSSARSVGE